MKNRAIFLFTRSALPLMFFAGITGLVSAGDDLPVLKKGMWEFTRSVQNAAGKAETLTNRKCTSPTEDWRNQNEMLTKMGCRFSPIKKEGNTYTFTADCTVKTPDGATVTSHTTSVITVESDSAYSVKVVGETSGNKTDETLNAKLIGGC